MKIMSTLAVLLLVFTANAIKLQHEGIDVTHENADNGNTLRNGDALTDAELLSSGNGYFAVFQIDGNFILYNSENFIPSNVIWASGSNGKGARPRRITMQNDGDLVIYDGEGYATWASGTYGVGTAPFKLVMQTDRNLVIYDVNGTPTWATGTNI
jgi:hypothetical protein